MVYTKAEVTPIAPVMKTVHTMAHTKGIPIAFDTVIVSFFIPTNNAYEADE